MRQIFEMIDRAILGGRKTNQPGSENEYQRSTNPATLATLWTTLWPGC